MVQRTLLVAAASYYQGELNQSPKGHEGAPCMVGHPQPLPTTHALLTQRRQAHLSWCGGTSLSSGHLAFSSVQQLLGNFSEKEGSTVFERRQHILNGFGSNETGFPHPLEEFLERGQVDLHAGNRSPQGEA